MFRLKKVHKALIIYIVVGLTILSVISRKGIFQNEVLETILEYENYTWSKFRKIIGENHTDEFL